MSLANKPCPRTGEGVNNNCNLFSSKTGEKRVFSPDSRRNSFKKSAITCLLAFSCSLGLSTPVFADSISIDRGAFILDKNKDDGNYYLRKHILTPFDHYLTPFQIDKKKITLVEGISRDVVSSFDKLKKFFRNFDEIYINDHFYENPPYQTRFVQS